MNAIDGVFCLGRACDKQTRDAFQPSRFTGVRLGEVTTLSGVVARERGTTAHRRKFLVVGTLREVFFVQKISPKMQNLELKTRMSSLENLQLSVGKFQLLAPPTFSTHDPADNTADSVEEEL